MRTRLTLAAIAILVGVIALGALRLFESKPAPEPLAGAPSAPLTVPSSAALVSPSPATESSEAAIVVSPNPVASEMTPPAAPTTSAAPTPAPTTSAAPTPTPTPTPDPNLLSMKNGAFVREWTLGAISSSPENLAEDGNAVIAPGFAHPVAFLFELPSAARIDRVSVTLRDAAPHGNTPAHVDVAVGADAHALRTIGTIEAVPPPDDDKERPLDIGANARFIRFTVRHAPNSNVHVEVAAYGTPGPAQRGALAGTWITADDISSSPQGVFAKVAGSVPNTLPAAAQNDPRVATEAEGLLSMVQCSYRRDVWRGGVFENVARAPGEALQLAGKGNLLVGYANGRYIMAFRSKPVAACLPTALGHGPTVLALVRIVADTVPQFDPAYFPGYRFVRHLAPLLDASQLQQVHFAVLNAECTATSDLLPRQQQLLLRWVAAGHKLIIRDSDTCSASDYSFLPYRFTTAATGARGARGAVLAIADPSTLGSGPDDPAHFIDTAAYLRAPYQQIGDADVIETDDPRWCGHLLATNALGANGWVHAYARYGRGLIIYNGLDEDDLSNRVPAALRLVQLEYAQPVQAELPCNARIASQLALTPSTNRSLPAGKPMIFRVPMNLAYASTQKAAQAVTLSIAGDTHFRASVSPIRVRVAPGAGLPVTATVQLPAGWSGAHAFTVTATGAQGQTAQATISLDGSVALAKAFASQRRVRIYGIHFDVDSAQIQPRSEDTIAQIAQVLVANRDWKMRVEGHTDSDGGAVYNQALSVRRARAVVADLVTRYHIAPARLTSAGFGLTRPVAPNTTEAGKALNRRVELVRL